VMKPGENQAGSPRARAAVEPPRDKVAPGSMTPPFREPQQTIAGLSGDWPANRGRVTLSDDFHERALEQPIRGSCARCGAVFVGLFRDERDWFKKHRRRCK
jgi:hypothetical protein